MSLYATLSMFSLKKYRFDSCCDQVDQSDQLVTFVDVIQS